MVSEAWLLGLTVPNPNAPCGPLNHGEFCSVSHKCTRILTDVLTSGRAFGPRYMQIVRLRALWLCKPRTQSRDWRLWCLRRVFRPWRPLPDFPLWSPEPCQVLIRFPKVHAHPGHSACISIDSEPSGSANRARNRASGVYVRRSVTRRYSHPIRFPRGAPLHCDFWSDLHK